MVSNRGSNWTVRGVTFLLWALAAASVAYWGLKLGSAPAVGAAPVAGVRAPATDPAAVGRLLGQSTATASAPAAPPAASRFQLIGVVASRSQQGAALIAVDGRAAKPYRVGSAIDDNVVLKAVEPRRAVLASGTGEPVATLELPAQPR